MDPRLIALRYQYQEANPPTHSFNRYAEGRHLLLRQAGEPTRPNRVAVVDSLFPQKNAGYTDTAGVDEGTADLLYGLVRGLQPNVVLETGTHRGRSTRAIVTALRDNAEVVMVEHSYTAFLDKGHCYTVDAEDYKIIERGAVPPEATGYVTPITGFTPDVYEQAPLKDLKGIDFAFLDGDHTDKGLLQDLAYVDAHRAPECWVAVDNSRDDGWPNLRTLLAAYTQYPRISLGTCTGLDLIWMRTP